MGNANIELSGKLTEEEAYGHLSGKIMDGISTGKVKTRKIKCSCPPLVIVKLAEYPALRAGMNAKRQLHENSRTTALEIFAIKRKSRKQACEFS